MEDVINSYVVWDKHDNYKTQWKHFANVCCNVDSWLVWY